MYFPSNKRRIVRGGGETRRDRERALTRGTHGRHLPPGCARGRRRTRRRRAANTSGPRRPGAPRKGAAAAPRLLTFPFPLAWGARTASPTARPEGERGGAGPRGSAPRAGCAGEEEGGFLKCFSPLHRLCAATPLTPGQPPARQTPSRGAVRSSAHQNNPLPQPRTTSVWWKGEGKGGGVARMPALPPRMTCGAGSARRDQSGSGASRAGAGPVPGGSVRACDGERRGGGPLLHPSRRIKPWAARAGREAADRQRSALVFLSGKVL